MRSQSKGMGSVDFRVNGFSSSTSSNAPVRTSPLRT
jgi:hypothetical protein